MKKFNIQITVKEKLEARKFVPPYETYEPTDQQVYEDLQDIIQAALLQAGFSFYEVNIPSQEGVLSE